MSDEVKIDVTEADESVDPETADSEDAAAADASDPATQLAQARAEAADNHDRYLRAVAELDNFRKRTVRIRAETRDETIRDVLMQVAPLLDNFRRALGQDGDDLAAFRQGIEIIHKQFNDILAGYGLQEIEAQGQPFDPNLHEAMMQVPSDEHEPGMVMQEMEKGYRLNDRVVRPSRVIVSAAKVVQDEPGPEDETDDNEGEAQ